MKNNYCTFYIVRHGQTEWNEKGFIQGHSDSPLTESGILQIKRRAKELQHIDFAAVFSSDLSRAKRTAEILTLEKKLAVTTTQILRERNFGRYEGKKNTVFQEELQDLLDEFDKATHEQKKKFKFPTTESDEELIARFITFLRETAVAYPDKNVLVVSHGAMMKALLIHLGFCGYEPVSIQNTAYVQIESDGIDFFIKSTEGIY